MSSYMEAKQLTYPLNSLSRWILRNANCVKANNQIQGHQYYSKTFYYHHMYYPTTSWLLLILPYCCYCFKLLILPELVVSWERWVTSLEHSHENTYFVVWCKEEVQICYLEVQSVRIRWSCLLLSAPCSFTPLLWFKFISSQQQ